MSNLAFCPGLSDLMSNERKLKSGRVTSEIGSLFVRDNVIFSEVVYYSLVHDSLSTFTESGQN